MYTTVSYDNLDTYLAGLAANTQDTPYEIEISNVTVSFLYGSLSSSQGTLQYALRNNATKYVSLKFEAPAELTSIGFMCYGCTSLVEITVTGMENVIRAWCAFCGCTSLVAADVSGMTSATKVFEMFLGCTSLTSVDVSDMTSVTDAAGMFQDCTRLTEIHGWSVPSTADMTDCFSGCTALEAIYVPEPSPSESSWQAWDIRKDTANSRSTVTVYNPDGTSNSVSVPSAGTYTMKVTDKVDELLFSPSEEIPAATIQKMLQTKAPITAKDALDPTRDNFMLWAKDRSSARTNVTTDTVNAGNKLPPTSEAVHAAISQIGLAMYPVGSIYMSVNSTDPKYIFGGDWEKLPDGAFIRNAGGNAGTVGQTQAEGLPNITGGWFGYTWDNGSPSGAITSSISNYNQVRSGDSNKNYVDYRFDASVNGTTLYGKSSHVTPYNYCVYMWRRKS